MRKIKVDKEELLGIVKENRKKHKKEFFDSVKAYRVKAADLFNAELQKIVNGEDFKTCLNSLQKPEPHIKDYDIMIQMLKMSVDKIIELDQDEFNQLVNDDWMWKNNFRSSYMSNSRYLGADDVSAFHGLGEVGNIGIPKIKFADDEIETEE